MNYHPSIENVFISNRKIIIIIHYYTQPQPQQQLQHNTVNISHAK